jgi:hypothetical protein
MRGWVEKRLPPAQPPGGHGPGNRGGAGRRVDDILRRARALRGLIYLRSIHPEEATAGSFQRGVGYENDELAAALRHDLAAWRLVTMDEKAKPVPVRLTKQGLHVADLARELDTLVPGLLERPRALAGLLAILEKDPAPLSAAELRAAVEYAYREAARLRDDYARLGVVTVEEGRENRTLFVRVRLTPLGRRAATLARKIKGAAETARDGKGTGHP